MSCDFTAIWTLAQSDNHVAVRLLPSQDIVVNGTNINFSGFMYVLIVYFLISFNLYLFWMKMNEMNFCMKQTVNGILKNDQQFVWVDYSQEIRRKIFGLDCPYNCLHEQYSWVNTFFYAHGWIILLPNNIFNRFNCEATRKKGSHFTFQCHQHTTTVPKMIPTFFSKSTLQLTHTALHR